MLVTALLLAGCISLPASAATPLLKTGAKGPSVFGLQLSLFQLGFLHVMPSGIFDTHTTDAVRQFQASRGLSADGTVGSQTWQHLKIAQDTATKTTYVVQQGDTLWSLARKYNITVYMLAQANHLTNSDELKVNQKLIIPVPGKTSAAKPAPPTGKPPVTAVKTDAQKAREAQARNKPELMPWSQVDRIFPAKATARVIDVATGRSFRVRRLYGHNHADSEPLTAEDTATMKAIYGGKWSWDRRPIVVEVAGHRIAASMNGYPHGGDSIANNNFAGQFCIHFLGSKTHGSNRVDPDHQAAVRKAAASGVGTVISH